MHPNLSFWRQEVIFSVPHPSLRLARFTEILNALLAQCASFWTFAQLAPTSSTLALRVLSRIWPKVYWHGPISTVDLF